MMEKFYFVSRMMGKLLFVSRIKVFPIFFFLYSKPEHFFLFFATKKYYQN